MNRIHRAPLHPLLNRHPGWAGRRPAGAHYRGAGQAADDPFCLAPSPAGTSLMNHTAAARGNPGKRGRSWLP
jgi:hypothetical protein